MILYYAPSACSLAAHIALNEAGLPFEAAPVDLRQRRTAAGGDYLAVNPKGYVPALVLDDGTVLTENVALLDWIAQQAEALAPASAMARTRQIEMLAFIAAEVHKPFVRLMFAADDAEKSLVRSALGGRFETLAGGLKQEHLLGRVFGVADAYLYVMLRWAQGLQVKLPVALAALFARIDARPSVQAALRRESAAA